MNDGITECLLEARLWPGSEKVTNPGSHSQEMAEEKFKPRPLASRVPPSSGVPRGASVSSQGLECSRKCVLDCLAALLKADTHSSRRIGVGRWPEAVLALGLKKKNRDEILITEFTTLTILRCTISGFEYIHSVGQPSSLPNARIFYHRPPK